MPKTTTTSLLLVTLAIISTIDAQNTTVTGTAPRDVVFRESTFPPCASDADVRTRLEWRQLTDAQRKEYLSAVQCLRKPGSGQNGTSTMFGEFAQLHDIATKNNWAHGYPVFLPWHRIYIGLYEYALRTLCSYSAPFPYWDWSYDVGELADSPVIADFGGDGTAATQYCINQGPFADLSDSTCMKRNLLPTARNLRGNYAWSWIEMQNDLATSTNFAALRQRLERGAHGAVHNFVGGNKGHMSKLSTASQDALFWMHHTNIDRWYYEWQVENPDKAADYNGVDLEGKPVTDLDVLHFDNLLSDVPVQKGVVAGKGTHALTCFKYAPPLRQVRVSISDPTATIEPQATATSTITHNGTPASATTTAGSHSTMSPRVPHRRQVVSGALAPHIPMPDSILAKNNCTGSCVTTHRELESEQDAFISFANANGWVPYIHVSEHQADRIISFTEEEYKKHKEAARRLIVQSPIYTMRLQQSEVALSTSGQFPTSTLR
ncbi:hypothetical protein DFS34DRAFT_16743 [Phlyctochytrium arcticum]|nr:hypothetical protein DFS34DRAFT_16743 [Phlyctochytrium arcticum]